MSYAHKLSTYDDNRVKVVFCTVCGNDADLAGPCDGPFKMSPKDDENFMRIFGGPSLKASNELKKVLKCT